MSRVRYRTIWKRKDGLELFESYREMAIANGVDPDDPVLADCRD